MRGGSPRRGDRKRSRSRSPRRGGKGPGYMKGDGTSKMVYVSNLPYEARWVELKNILREYGEISFVEILEDRNGRSKGSAIAEFKTREDAENCVRSMSPRYDMNGRSVIVKEISNPTAFLRKVKEETGVDYLSSKGPRDDPRNAGNTGNYESYGLSPEFLSSHNIQLPLTDRVFVANIPFNIQTGRICDIFSMAGRITWIDLSLDKEGRSRGTCVIQFSHPLEAVQAVSMFNHQKLLDRPLGVKIDKCEKHPERQPGELPKGLVSIGMGLGADGAPLKDVTSVLSSLRSDAYVGNMPVGLPEPTLPVIGPSMGLSMGGASFGSGATVAPVPAPSFGGLGGHNIEPYGSSSAFSGTAAQSGGYGGVSSNYGGSSRTSSNAFAGGSGDGSFSSRTVLIKNLPKDYTWNIVNDRLSTYGEVESTEMVGPGMARIRYVHLSDAEGARQALSGTVVEGRPIQVDYVH